MGARFYTLIIIFLLLSCQIEERVWSNPYDPDSDRSLWTPSDLAVLQVEDNLIELTWKRNGADFDGFKIDKRLGDNVWQQSVAILGDSTFSWMDTLNLKTLVNNPVEYGYRIYAYAGKNESNKISIKLVPQVPGAPSSVDVQAVEYTTEPKIIVTWFPSDEEDFQQYTLLHAIGEFGEKNEVFVVTEKSTTFYSTSTFDPTIENWYWVEVSDTTGQSVLGKGKGHEVDPRPEIVLLDTIIYGSGEFILVWSQSQEADFKGYHLLEIDRSDSSVINTINSFSNITDTTEIISVNVDEDHHYRVSVSDYWGQSSASNIRSGTSYQNIVKLDELSTSGAYMSIINLSPNLNARHDLKNVKVSFPVWIQGGEKIYAFSENSAGLFVKENGTDLTIFNELPNNDQPRDIGFNDKGTMAVFSTIKGAIYTLDLENSIYNQIPAFPDNNENYGEPEFIPNGRILFWRTEHQSNNNLGVKDLYTMDLSGENIIKITNAVNFQKYTSGRLSPDGTILAYVYEDQGIYFSESDGTDSRRATTRIPDESIYFKNLRWSPDGSKLLYWSEGVIYTIASNGTGENIISAGRYANWTDDSQEIIFQYDWNFSGTAGRMYIVAVNGGAVRSFYDGPWAQLQPRQ